MTSLELEEIERARQPYYAPYVLGRAVAETCYARNPDSTVGEIALALDDVDDLLSRLLGPDEEIKTARYELARAFARRWHELTPLAQEGGTA